MDDKTLEYMRERVKKADAKLERMANARNMKDMLAKSKVAIYWRDNYGTSRGMFDTIPQPIADAIVAYFDQQLVELQAELDAI